MGRVFCYCCCLVVLFSPTLNLSTMLKKSTDHEDWEADSWVATGQVPTRECELLTSQKNLISLYLGFLAKTLQSGFELLRKFLVDVPGVSTRKPE